MSPHIVPFTFVYLPSIVAGILGVVCLVGWLRLRRAQSLSPAPKILLAIFSVQLLHVTIYTWLLWRAVLRLQYSEAYLPPESPFLFDRAAQGITSVIAGWVFALLVFSTLWFIFVRRGKEMVLDRRDCLLLVIGVAAVGWPEGLIFIGLTFLFGVLWLLVLILVGKKKITDRLEISPVILPAILATLVASRWLLMWTHLDKIRF